MRPADQLLELGAVGLDERGRGGDAGGEGGSARVEGDRRVRRPGDVGQAPVQVGGGAGRQAAAQGDPAGAAGVGREPLGERVEGRAVDAEPGKLMSVVASACSSITLTPVRVRPGKAHEPVAHPTLGEERLEQAGVVGTEEAPDVGWHAEHGEHGGDVDALAAGRQLRRAPRG